MRVAAKGLKSAGLRKGGRLATAGIALLMAAGAPADADAAGKTKAYVLTVFNDMYGPYGQDTSQGCPLGSSLTGSEEYALRMGLKADAVDIKGKYSKLAATGPNGEELCKNPTAVPDPGMRVYQGKTFAYGIDLDGAGDKKTAPGTCQHEDFIGPNGEKGIDNQFYRVVGCFPGIRAGTLDAYNGGLIDGKPQPENYYLRNGTTILVEVTGIDNEQNDDAVDVAVYSTSTPVLVAPTGLPVLSYASFRPDDNPRWQNKTHGRIKNGVLTTDVFDLRLHQKWSMVDTDYYIRGARMSMTFRPDGSFVGLVGGYYDLDTFWKAQRGFVATSNGYSCPGLYYALHKYADGFPDPVTGKCTAISTAKEIAGVPAFVDHAAPTVVAGDPEPAKAESVAKP